MVTYLFLKSFHYILQSDKTPLHEAVEPWNSNEQVIESLI